MNDLLNGYKFIRAYIDELFTLTKVDWTDHVQKLQLALTKLKEKGLKYNIEKYFFVKTKMKILVFWVTRDGVRPTTKQIEAITNMNPPNSQK